MKAMSCDSYCNYISQLRCYLEKLIGLNPVNYYIFNTSWNNLWNNQRITWKKNAVWDRECFSFHSNLVESPIHLNFKRWRKIMIYNEMPFLKTKVGTFAKNDERNKLCTI